MSNAIASITLHYPNGQQPTAMSNEREQAISDLCKHAKFAFHNDDNPPYHLDLSIYNRQLVLKTTDAKNVERPHLVLSLSPYRAIIRDYFMMIESYERARIDGNQQRLEPIDMARRGLHNEAADLMIERLQDKITMDHETARRFFTLICVLHMDQTRFRQT